MNGDVTSPAALVASPGRDGISLREAILATNAAAGTSRITFAEALAGQTIALESFLPAFERDGVSLVGIAGADGGPTVTIDGRNADQMCCPGLLAVTASDVVIQRIRVVHAAVNFVNIQADEPGGPKAIRNVRIEDCVFSDSVGGTSQVISIGTDFPGTTARVFAGRGPAAYAGAVDAIIGNVAILRNVFRDITGNPAGDAVILGAAGTNVRIEDVLIQGNLFTGLVTPGTPAVELVSTFTNSRILRTKIVGNTFTRNWAPIHLNGAIAWDGSAGDGLGPRASTGNTIADTVVTGNVFTNNQYGIGITAGAGGSKATATSNTITNTEISNNLMSGAAGAVDISGGAKGATGNSVQGVHILRDTIALNDGGIVVRADRDGGAGNAISAVEVRDSILWMNGGSGDLFGPTLSALQVFSSVTTAAGFAGRNGNISSDPLFVDATHGDFRLAPGSPATGKGYSP